MPPNIVLIHQPISRRIYRSAQRLSDPSSVDASLISRYLSCIWIFLIQQKCPSASEIKMRLNRFVVYTTDNTQAFPFHVNAFLRQCRFSFITSTLLNQFGDRWFCSDVDNVRQMCSVKVQQLLVCAISLKRYYFDNILIIIYNILNNLLCLFCLLSGR